MSETVKIIVTLSKGQYEHLKDTQYGGIGARMIFNEVVKGKPLSEVLGEIKGEISEIPKKYPMTKEYEYGLNEAMAIIDKHIGKGDSEDDV